jgi:hypothetical protein
MWINGRWVTFQAEGEGGGAGGGAGAGDWRAALPEAVRADPALKDFKGVPELAQSFIETKKLVGTSIRVPPPEAGPEARKAFVERLQKDAPELVLVPEDEKLRAEVEGSIWQKLGRPKEAKEYSVQGVDLAPGIEVNEDELRALGTKIGLTKAQYRELAKVVAGEKGAALQAVKQNQAALKKELGAAYDERLGAAAAAARKLGAPEAMVKAIKEGALPLEQAKVWIAVAKAIGGEGAQVGGQGAGGGGGLTPAEAKARAAEIRQRPEYWDRSKNPGLHDTLIAKHAEYMQQAYPEES